MRPKGRGSCGINFRLYAPALRARTAGQVCGGSLRQPKNGPLPVHQRRKAFVLPRASTRIWLTGGSRGDPARQVSKPILLHWAQPDLKIEVDVGSGAARTAHAPHCTPILRLPSTPRLRGVKQNDATQVIDRAVLEWLLSGATRAKSEGEMRRIACMFQHDVVNGIANLAN